MCTEAESHSVASCACLASSLQRSILETSVVLHESVVHLLVLLLVDLNVFELTGNAVHNPLHRASMELPPHPGNISTGF